MRVLGDIDHFRHRVIQPVVFAATLVLVIWRITAHQKIRWVLLPIPVIYLGIDIIENLLIEVMFATTPVDPGAVATASTFTVLKFILFAACLAAALVALLTRPRTT